MTSQLSEEIRNALTEPQQEIYVQFIEAIRDTEINPLMVDDWTYVRFLRARDFILADALLMYKNYAQWRIDEDIDNIYEFSFDEYKQFRLAYPHGFHQTDREGRPVYIERVGQIDVDALYETSSLDRMLRYYTRIYETTLQDKVTAWSALVGKRVHQYITIMDLEGLTMKLADKRVKEQLTKAAKITSDYYPETMYKMFIINAPSFFTFLWSFVKGLVNEKTREKIHIYSKPSQWKPALLEHIDEDKLPELFGGTCKCKFGCIFNDPGPWNPDNLLYDKYTKLPGKKQKEVTPHPQQNLVLSLDSDLEDELSFGFCDIKRSDLVMVNEIYQLKFDKYKFPVKQIPPELSTIRDELTEAD